MLLTMILEKPLIINRICAWFFFNKSNSKGSSSVRSGLIPYGNTTSSGGHDHRTNRGEDRTPAQKAGDKSRQKDNGV